MQDWHDIIKSYNITYLNQYPDKQPPNSLYVTRCCAIKTPDSEAIPRHFYLSGIVQRFINFCDNNNFNYAILSDLYGIHFKDEILKTYDIHPSSLDEGQLFKLGELIRTKCTSIGVNTIYYYNPSPLMSIPYFKMLNYSKLKTYYLTNLDIEQKYNEISDDIFA